MFQIAGSYKTGPSKDGMSRESCSATINAANKTIKQITFMLIKGQHLCNSQDKTRRQNKIGFENFLL